MPAELIFPLMSQTNSSMLSTAIKSSNHGDLLQSTRNEDSQQLSKEIIKGVVIVLPMVAALILAPMLLSYSRRRLLGRSRSKLSRPTFCCCRDRTMQSNRDDQRVIIEISEQNMNVEETSITEPIAEKCPTKPSLKKSKMFVETAGITSDANETQVEEAAEVEIASVGCFPENPLIQFGAKVFDRRRFDDGHTTAHSRLTVFENNAYEDTIPSLVDSSMDMSYASSAVERFRDVTPNPRYWKDSPEQKLKKNLLSNSSIKPTISHPLALHFFPPSSAIDRNMLGRRPSRNRITRRMSEKERWQPLYPKSKNPETVSMFGYEFANDVIHGHVPPSPLLPAPFHAEVQQRNELKCRKEIDCLRDDSLYTENRRKTSSISPLIYSPHVGAVSTKLSTVSTRRSKRKIRKSRRFRDHLRQRWQQRLLQRHASFKSDTLDSYGTSNNERISGYIGNQSRGNILASDCFESEINRKRCQLSEKSLLEEIWQHLKLLVERTNQGQDLKAAKECLSERISDHSSAHTVVPSTNEQLDSPLQRETSTTDNSSSGISVQMYPCLKTLTLPNRRT